MPADSAAFLIHCQLALGFSQEELGELLDRNRRTIQRWQERGFEPTVAQAETLAQALQSVRDLTRAWVRLDRKSILDNLEAGNYLTMHVGARATMPGLNRESGSNPELPRSGNRERTSSQALAPVGTGKRRSVGSRRKPERS
jgi:transcriptional regulator with XRE-family HTH domain